MSLCNYSDIRYWDTIVSPANIVTNLERHIPIAYLSNLCSTSCTDLSHSASRLCHAPRPWLIPTRSDLAAAFNYWKMGSPARMSMRHQTAIRFGSDDMGSMGLRVWVWLGLLFALQVFVNLLLLRLLLLLPLLLLGPLFINEKYRSDWNSSWTNVWLGVPRC